MNFFQNYRFFAAISGFTAVAMGAVAAHATPAAELAALMARGSEYQLIHAGVLLWLAGQPGRVHALARAAMLAGMSLFSFSLYAKGLGWTGSAPLAPFGGTLLMASWLLVAAAAVTRNAAP